jgi:hypothetical protein
MKVNDLSDYFTTTLYALLNHDINFIPSQVNRFRFLQENVCTSALHLYRLSRQFEQIKHVILNHSTHIDKQIELGKYTPVNRKKKQKKKTKLKQLYAYE